MEISREELAVLIEAAVVKASKSHGCFFSAEEKQMLKDLATGGKVFKRIVIYLVVGFLLVGIGLQSVPNIIKALK